MNQIQAIQINTKLDYTYHTNSCWHKRIYFLIIYIFKMAGNVCHGPPMEVVRQLSGVFVFHYDLGDQTQLIGLGGKCHYLPTQPSLQPVHGFLSSKIFLGLEL